MLACKNWNVQAKKSVQMLWLNKADKNKLCKLFDVFKNLQSIRIDDAFKLTLDEHLQKGFRCLHLLKEVSFSQLDLTNCTQYFPTNLHSIHLISCDFGGDFIEHVISNNPNLEELSLRNCTGTEDISFLNRMSRLKHLSLAQFGMSNEKQPNPIWNTLKPLHNLKSINFSYEHISDSTLEWLSSCKELTSISLYSCRFSKEISYLPLITLDHLEYLNCGYTPQPFDLAMVVNEMKNSKIFFW